MTSTAAPAGAVHPGGPGRTHPAVAVAEVPRWTTALDVVIAAGLAVWGLLEVLVTPGLPRAGSVACALAATLPLALRRRFPCSVATVLAAALLVQGVVADSGRTFTPFPSLLVATFTVGVQVGPLWRAVAFGALPAAAMAGASQLGYYGPEGREARAYVILIFFFAAAWSGGRVVRHRALAALAAEAGRDEAAEQAVTEERARIARELHDVVAHTVSVVVLHTGAAEQFIGRDDERARTHVGLARRTATEAMTEMRRLLDVLREAGPVYDPQPGLSAVADLVDEARAAGLPVTLTVSGEEVEVPDGPALAAYRIVQEALTNVRKHAPGAATSVHLAVSSTHISIAVTNARPSAPAPARERGGHGIPGMRERIRVYGGRLEVGQDPDGGWAVRARIPTGAA